MDNVYYSAKNSQTFKAANAKNWESSGLKPDSVNFWNQDVTNKEISVKVEQTAANEYVVYMDDETSDSVRKLMTDFFLSEAKKEYTDEAEAQKYAGEMAAALKALTIKTYGSVNVVPDDFSYINTTFANIEILNLGSAALEGNAIPENAMKSSGELKKLTLPSTVLTIGKYAFYGCNIEELTLPASVTSVGEGAFQRDADKKKKVYVTWSSENQIDKNVLSGFDTSYTRFFMSEYQALNMETWEPAWSAYTYELYDFMIQDGSSLTFLKEVSGDDGKDYVRIVFYENTGSFDRSMIQASYTADSGIPYPYRGRTFYTKSIGVNAFRLVGEANAGKTVELVFPDTCTEIRANAFRPVTDTKNYQISKLDLNYVNAIGDYAFYKARIMYSKARPGGSKGKTAFAGMTSLGTGAFEGVGFYPADVADASKIDASHYQGKSKTDIVYEAGTLDLSANRNAWNGDWSSAQPQLAVKNMTAAGGIVKLGNYYRFGDYGYRVNASSDFGIRLYGVKLDLTGCEYLSKQVFKDSFPKAQNTKIQQYNVLDLTNIKGFGYSVFENDYIGTVYAGITDEYWQSEGGESFSWDCTRFNASDTNGYIFQNGSVLTLDIQGHVPASADSGVSIFSRAVYGTVQLHMLADQTTVTSYLLADSTVDQIRIYDVENVTFGSSCFANVTGSGESGVEVSIAAGGTVSFGDCAWKGARLKKFDLAASSGSVIEIGKEAFYGISFEDMSTEDFTSFYGTVSKNQNTALICGSTFPDDMKTLDLRAGSVFAIRADNQYQDCNMNQIASILWPVAETGKESVSENAIRYNQVMRATEWPNLTSLSLEGVQITGTGTFEDAKLPKVTALNLHNIYPAAEGSQAAHNEYLLPQSTFENADLSGVTKLDLSGVCVQSCAFRSADLRAVTAIVTNADQKTCMCSSAGTDDGQQFAGADLTGLKDMTTWHVASLGRACFYGVMVGKNATWRFEDLTGFDGYLTFSGITKGTLRLEFPELTTCIPNDTEDGASGKQLAQFDSSPAISWIEFGADMGKDGIALGGSCTDADGTLLADYSTGVSSTEFRGMTDCTVRFQNTDCVVQLFQAWNLDKLGTGVKFIVPQKLLSQYLNAEQNPDWSAVASRITGDQTSYTAYTYLYVGTSSEEVQLVRYSGDAVTLAVPEYITVSSTDGGSTSEKTLRVTQLSAEFLEGSSQVKELILPSAINYMDPAMFDGTGVETISFYSSTDSDEASYYRAENSTTEVKNLDGIGERTITSRGKLLLNGTGTVLLRAMPGASYEGNTDGNYYEIPVTVKGIGSGAFRGTGATAIAMSSVSAIAGDAFADSAKGSSGNSITSLKFAMSVPPVLSGDALQIFRKTEADSGSVRLEGKIVVPGLVGEDQTPDVYLDLYRSAAGFLAYKSLIQADTSLAPYTEEENELYPDEAAVFTYTDGRGVTWYYKLDDEAQTAILTGVKEGLPTNAEETFFLPVAVTDGVTWYPVSRLDFTEEQESYLNEIRRYEVVQQMQEDGTRPPVIQQLYVDEYGVLYRIYSKAGSSVIVASLVRYPASSELTQYTVPKWLTVEGTIVTGDTGTTDIATSDEAVRVKQIASYAFNNATNLKALYIPTAVLRKISIEENAFAGTSDEFTVFGGDDAKDDVVILKTEVDQKTWEKIQKWLNGESVESDLPEGADDTDDVEHPEATENSGEAEPVVTVEDTDVSDIPQDVEDTDTAGIPQNTEVLEDTEASETTGNPETAGDSDVTENPVDQEIPEDVEYPEDSQAVNSPEAEADSQTVDSPEAAADSEVTWIDEDTE
jgi:uncharacterized protein YjbI with pentapeptide repeats